MNNLYTPQFVDVAERFVSDLITLLDAPEVETKKFAIHMLGWIGPEAKEAVLALRAIVEGDGDDDIRNSAAQTLGIIGKASSEAVPVLVEALDKSMIPKWWHLIPLSCELLSDSMADTAFALGEIGVINADVTEVLVRALRRQREVGEKPECRWVTGEKAARALGKLEIGEPPVVLALIFALSDKNDSVRNSAFAALENLGLNVVATHAFGGTCYWCRDPKLIEKVAELFKSFGKDAIPLLEEVKDSNPDGRARSAAAKILDAMIEDVK